MRGGDDCRLPGGVGEVVHEGERRNAHGSWKSGYMNVCKGDLDEYNLHSRVKSKRTVHL